MTFPIGFLTVYLIVVLFVGVWVGRRKATAGSWQFGHGGLSVASIVAMLLGTRLGATATVGLAEDVYTSGIVAFSFIFGQIVGSILCAFTTGKLFYRTKMMTLPALTYHRLGKRVTILGILIDVVIGLAVNGIQVLGVGLIIQALTGIPLIYGIAIGSFLGWIYLTLGGINATAATNIIHLVVCFVGILGGVVMLLGIMPFGAAVDAVPPDLLRPVTPFITVVRWTIVGIAISIVANVYHSPLATARSEKSAIAASVLTGLIYGLFGFLVTVMGIYALAWAGPAYEAGQGHPLPARLAFGTIATLLGNEQAGGSAVGGVVGLVMMSGVIGAIISTMAPLAWAISTILSRDVYKKFIKPDATDREELLATRIFSTVYWLVPGIIALKVNQGLLSALLFLLELPVGGFLAAFLGFYWKRVNDSAAFYTLLTSISFGILHFVFYSMNPEMLDSFGPWFGSSVGWIVTASLVVFFLCVFLGQPATDAQWEVVRRARANEPAMDDAPGKLLDDAVAADAIKASGSA
jgi:Na+/proline symporter